MKTRNTETTCDAIMGGALTLVQPRHGYRFSVDSVLLARFATVRSAERVLELGAGCGIIAIMLAVLARPREIVALELQPELVTLIERNAERNGVATVRAIGADLRTPVDGLAPGSFDLVVANPPYRALGRGRESPHAGRRVARAEAEATLAEFVAATARYARSGGRAALVFAASRSAELVACLRAHALEPKRIRFVHPRPELPAATVLVEVRKNGGAEVRIEPPLILYAQPGVYSAEAASLLNSLGGSVDQR